MTIHVQKPGLLSTVQDLGRYGYQRHGVIVSGAMDQFAHKAANILVGNLEQEATLEITLIGPVLFFGASALISICGADLSPRIEGIPVPLWRPVYIKEGTTIRFGSAQEGSRCYLAVSGGIQVPLRMNSYSTYLRAGIGGFDGRALKEKDLLPIQPPTPQGERMARKIRDGMGEASFGTVSWFVSYELMPMYKANPEVRVVLGAQYDLFTEESIEALLTAKFQVQPQSDRMGYRLAGVPLRLRENQDMLSEPVAFGTIQVPPDGNPIVLMADRQTTGGYPKIAQVITADLPLLAQAQIGSKIRYRLVELDEAQNIHIKVELGLQFLRHHIHMRFL